MGVRKFYSKRKEQPGPAWKWDEERVQWWSWGFDIWLHYPTTSRKCEAGFFSRAQAAHAVETIWRAEKERNGHMPQAARPRLSDLIEKRLAQVSARGEHVSQKRVLTIWLSLLPSGLSIEEVKTPHLALYVEKRFKDGMKASSIDRELNIISAALHAAVMFYPELEQWQMPRIPRPQRSKMRRERVITDEEIKALLGYLLAPRGEGEWPQVARARRRVGLQVRFALLTGMRHGEINAIRKEHIDWHARSLKVIGTKTDTVRYISPLTGTMLSILKECSEQSQSPFVFTRSGRSMPNFYSILREACHSCGIPYGCKVEGRLVLHDARHTATTRLLQAGSDLSTVQSFMGRATPQSRERAASMLEGYAGESEDETA